MEYLRTFIKTCKPTHFVCVLQVVVIDLLDGLEVNDSFHLGLVFVCSREREHNRLFPLNSSERRDAAERAASLSPAASPA